MCRAVLWLLLLPFRLVWHAVAIYCLPCLGAYAESAAWSLCCFVCLACSEQRAVRYLPETPKSLKMDAS